jgi:hypothetical protein
MVDQGMPSSAELFRVDFTGDCVTDATTAWHVFHLMDSLSHCLLQKPVFPHTNIVAFRGGSTPKWFQNFTVTVSMVSPE